MARVVGFFQDETGEEGYYMVSMVIHDMGERIDTHIRDYETRLRASELADIPFHVVKLLHGHEGYEDVSAADRKRMLVAFATFVRRLPISYHVFSYTSYDLKGQAQLATRLESDIGRFLDSRLEELPCKLSQTGETQAGLGPFPLALTTSKRGARRIGCPTYMIPTLCPGVTTRRCLALTSVRPPLA